MMGFLEKIRRRVSNFVSGLRLKARRKNPIHGPVPLADPFWGDLDRIFSRRLFPAVSPWWPAIDLRADDGEYVLTADLPGMDGDGIDICVSGDRLVIRGERRGEREEKGNGFYRVERSYGVFHRSIELPADADPEHASADYSRGVLTVRIPRSESRVRHVPIAA